MGLPAEQPRADGLPAREFWLVDPRSKAFEPSPTPIDDRRLILVDELIEYVKSTIDPEYRWKTNSKDLNEHHLRWPKRSYPSLPWRPDADNPRLFWNLPPERGILPIEFHNWLHQVTIPPPVPKKEVRRLRFEGWRVARNLFNRVEGSARRELRLPELKGDDQIAIEYMEDVLERNFMGVEKYLDSIRKIPPELRFLEPHDNPRELAVALGAVSLTRTPSFVSIVVGTQPIAA